MSDYSTRLEAARAELAQLEQFLKSREYMLDVYHDTTEDYRRNRRRAVDDKLEAERNIRFYLYKQALANERYNEAKAGALKNTASYDSNLLSYYRRQQLSYDARVDYWKGVRNRAEQVLATGFPKKPDDVKEYLEAEGKCQRLRLEIQSIEAALIAREDL